MSVRNELQALVPTKSKALRNKLGTAPGIMFENNSKFVFALPGVPKEMMFIMEDSIIPFIGNLITERKKPVVLYKTLLTIGIAESLLADLIGTPEEFLEGGTLAFLPSYQGVKLRIGVDGSNFDIAQSKVTRIENILRAKAGKYIYGEAEQTISSVVGEILKEKHKTVSVAESCTGGLLGGAFTDVSGSSSYFIGGVIVYSNEAKIRNLGVKSETIEKYGTVSEETATELATKVRTKFDTDFGIGITGIAGPSGGSEKKPVGTVWICLADKKESIARKYFFGADRQVNRERAVNSALALLYNKLLEL